MGVTFFSVVILTVAAILLYYYFEKQRSKALQAIAQSMGFSLCTSPPPALESRMKLFKLFDKGHQRIPWTGRRRGLRNIIRMEKDGLAVYQFDYSYTVHSGKDTHTYNQTVTLFTASALNMPRFIMGPENMFHKIGDFLGIAADIDFPDFPEFSRQYRLRAENEENIRCLFNSNILHFFTNNPKYDIEGHADSLLVYKHRRTISPKIFRQTMEERFGILKLYLKNTAF